MNSPARSSSGAVVPTYRLARHDLPEPVLLDAREVAYETQ
ncbi:hypothetical protein J2Z77_002062 [Streptomyces avidinii]|uniref:Uncharacterized protein n=1 Tax=Streptomyces avidinii TaxID=1895 RepID=A0ABS4L1W4_STRAV|nr:hypothetical protein [Streptomyces avidinii]